MKLLSKADVQKKLTDDRKREIDEGAKLARKVDTLRKVSSEEEVNLRKFREETLKSIQSEITSKIGEKEILLNEIQTLSNEISCKKEERIRLSQPVDLQEEWKKVSLEEKRIDNIKRELSDRETALITRELRLAGFNEREEKLFAREKEAQSYLTEAQLSYRKSEDIRSEIETRKKNLDSDIQRKERELQDKDQVLVNREYEVGRLLSQIEKEKKELLDKGTELISRESKIDVDTKILHERKDKIDEMNLVATQYFSEMQKKYEVAEQVEKESITKKEQSDRDIQNRYSDLVTKEKELAFRETDLLNNRESLKKEQDAIEIEKKHISSQQETLRQAWNAIKKLKQ